MAIVDVIQFEGDPNILVWKSPVEDFNTGTQLIVDETHEAIVMVEGRTEVFGAGRHSLDSQNYFGLNAIQRMATGGKTIFPCKVFYVNKVHAMDMLWGTTDKLPVMDPDMDIMLHLRLRGNLTFTIENSKKFMEKFSGFINQYDSRQTSRMAAQSGSSYFMPDQVIQQLRGIISTEVTDQVAKVVTNAKIGLFSINAHLKDISQLLSFPLGNLFDEYGMKLVRFNIETITSDNEDTAEFQMAKSAAAARVIAAGSEAEARRIQGYTWSDEQKANILKELAGNDGAAGSFMGGVLGIGAGGPMTEPITGIVDNFFGNGSRSGGAVNDVFSNGAQSMGDAANAAQSNPLATASQPAANPLADMMGGVQQPNAAAGQSQGAGLGIQGFNLQEADDQSAQTAATQPIAQQPSPQTAQTMRIPTAAGDDIGETSLMCGNCGAKVDPAWKACPFCANPLGKPKCPSCGQEVDAAWKACPFCANPL